MDIVSLLYRGKQFKGYRVLEEYTIGKSNKVRDIAKGEIAELDDAMKQGRYDKYTKIDTITGKRISKASIVILSLCDTIEEEDIPIRFIVANCNGVTKFMGIDELVDLGREYGIANISIELLINFRREYNKLNEEQQRAVMNRGRVLSIQAGAGTGKTRVLVLRIVALILALIKPKEILCITFTNKAVNEIRERLCSIGVKGVNIRTIHSECLRIVRGDRPVEIVDKTDERYNRYDAVYLEDLEVLAKEVIDSKGVQGLYRSILIDEFQDTSRYEMDIIKSLINDDTTLTVVGDTDQTIYKFRGVSANDVKLSNYIDSEVTIISLQDNYRCTQEILNTAKYLVKFIDNSERSVTAHRRGQKPKILIGKEQGELSNKVVDEIESLHNKGVLYSDIGILYRSKRDNTAEEVRVKLESRRIPIVRSSTTLKLRREFIDTINNEIESSEEIEKMNKKVVEAKQFIEFEGDTASHIDEHIPSRGEVHTRGGINLSSDEDRYTVSKCEIPKDISISIVQNTVVLLRDRGVLSKKLSEELRLIINGSEDGYSAYESVMEYLSTSRVVGETEGVSIITMHRSKGLEFKYVFILDIDNEHFPLIGEELEDEIRLAYVAYTRAKDRLYLCCNDITMNKKKRTPSVFITMPYKVGYIAKNKVYEVNSMYYGVTAMDYINGRKN